MTRKSINTTLDTELYSKIKTLALKVSAEKQTKVNASVSAYWIFKAFPNLKKSKF